MYNKSMRRSRLARTILAGTLGAVLAVTSAVTALADEIIVEDAAPATEDEGIILLLDDRFLKKEYLELFPREWEHFQMVNRKNVGQCLSDFWESRGR